MDKTRLALLSPLLFILVLKALNRDIRQDEKTMDLKIKEETFKLRAFADNLVVIFQDPLKGIFLIKKMKVFGALADFQNNK